uniref:Uncharacterized protein n=1 Tax=Zea mays TaxID=4577 RepID=E7DDW5_MAIZE|nr:hypothetical protein [Zea mays]
MARLDLLDGFVPGGPVGGAANTGHGVDLGEGVDLEGGAAHGALAVDARHGLEPVHGVLEALEPSVAVEHAARGEGRVGLAAAALDQRAVGLDDQHRLVGGAAAQAVLADEAAEVVEAAQEDAVDVVQAAEHPLVRVANLDKF